MNKLILVFGIIGAFLLSSCSNEKELDLSTDNSLSLTESKSILSKDEGMARFSEILSKAAYEKKEIRDFLKSQALEKIDNGYNIFYPIAKDKKLTTGETLRDILIEYSSIQDIEEIEEAVPLLNIHVPEIADIKASDIDTNDKEIPFLYSNHIYLDGAIVDSLDNDEVPGFNLYVVTESSNIRKKQDLLKRASSDLSLNAEYEYVDPAFSPVLSNKKLLKTSGVESLDDKYNGQKGYIPLKEIDPELINAYRNSKDKPKATRCLMYYNMNTPSQTPDNVRSDVKDCIFRFKINGSAFEDLESTTTDGGHPLFNGSTENKKTPLSREEVINRLLTGRNFCFKFKLEGNISEGSANSQVVTSEEITIYASPKDLFNLYIHEERKHPTAFRHTKYTYWIDKKNITEKWYYPLDNGHDTRLDKWDVAYQPISKRIVVYLINPNSGQPKEVEERYSVTYVTTSEAGADIAGDIKNIAKIGINGKITSSTTTVKEVTTKYTINPVNYKFDPFFFHFFNDYPIERIEGDKVIPSRTGRGIIEMSILPISNSFYNYGRFHN